MEIKRFISVIIFSLISGGLVAQNINVYSEQDIRFGDFYIDGSGTGTVTISEGGERTATANVRLLPSHFSPAIFRITTESLTPVKVAVEVYQEMLMNSDGHKLMLKLVPSDQVLTIKAGEPARIFIGGTIELTPENNSAVGKFGGNISINVVRYNE